MAAGRLIWPLIEPVLSATGLPVSGAVLSVFANRTTTPVTVYADEALVTPVANPQSGSNASNAAGRFFVQTKVFWVDADALYTLKVTRPDGSTDTVNDIAPQGAVPVAGRLVTTLTSTAGGGKFGERIEITNPTSHSGYAVRFAANIHTGDIADGATDISDTLISQWSSVHSGSAWGRWDVVTSPLGFGSGYTGAPTTSQTFYMVTTETNPQNRAGDPGGWKPEARLYGGTVVGGEQMVAETQDFSATLGNTRVGYNITFAYTINHSPFAANIGGAGNRHARFYTGFLAHPNSIAAGGYGVYLQGYRDFLIAAAISAGGSGYVVGDILTLNTGTDQNYNENSTLKVLTVNGSGAVLTAEVYTAGGYTSAFASPIGVTGGTGTGATFTYSYSVVGTESPAAALGIGGTWGYGIDFNSGNASFRKAAFSGACFRVPTSIEIVKGRNAADSADVSILKWRSDDLAELSGLKVQPPIAWVPTLSADSGAFTTIAVVDARYSIINGVCHGTINVHVTTKGTAAGALRFTQPVAPKASVLEFYAGGCNATTGVALVAQNVVGNGYFRVARAADGGDPLADATFYSISFFYEVA